MDATLIMTLLNANIPIASITSCLHFTSRAGQPTTADLTYIENYFARVVCSEDAPPNRPTSELRRDKYGVTRSLTSRADAACGGCVLSFCSSQMKTRYF